MADILDTDIKYLKGFGPRRADMLEKNLGIRTYRDLLYHFPTSYVDRSVQVRGRFVSITVQGEGAKSRLVGLFSDGSGVMEVVWFQRIKAMRELYHTSTEYVVFGKPTPFNGRWSMVQRR